MFRRDRHVNLTSAQTTSRTSLRAAIVVAASLIVSVPAALAESSAVTAQADSRSGVDLASLGWIWPAERFRVGRPYIAPAHEYGPGHRGVDLDLMGDVSVRSPADGIVAFAGEVAGRGIVTIDHGGGLVTTLEPVSTALTPGTAVRRGESVASLTRGGHAPAGSLHFGVRQEGEYINPLLLLGGVPRAILLPCCV